MSKAIPVTATNDKPNQTHPITINCNVLWSQAQQFSYLRLSDKRGDEYKLITNYIARARRISATYAHFYLESEEGGDPSKIGRYYWMALGAFASKTVACLMDKWQLSASNLVGAVTPDRYGFRAIADGLGQGNFWLFGDIAPAHWFYSKYPHNFFNGMDCVHKRHCEKLVEPVKSYVKDLPWSAKSLSKINYFQSSPDLIEGFEYVVQIEKMADSKQKQKKQFKHLIAIANHEQGAILQPLIYDDPDFNSWTIFQRERLSCWVGRMFTPDYDIVFSHQCSTEDVELKSVAPDDFVVEDFDSRMRWITDVAKTFHKLMRTKPEHMNWQLQLMRSWDAEVDTGCAY